MEYIDSNFASPLANVLPYISHDRLRYCARAVQDKTGTGNDRCIGFVDGTFRPHARPSEMQEVPFNGHYRNHGFRWFRAFAGSTENGHTHNLTMTLGQRLSHAAQREIPRELMKVAELMRKSGSSIKDVENFLRAKVVV